MSKIEGNNTQVEANDVQIGTNDVQIGANDVQIGANVQTTDLSQEIAQEIKEFFEKVETVNDKEWGRITQIKNLCADLPKIELQLTRQSFNWGFSFYFGYFPHDKTYLPISAHDGWVLHRQFDLNEKSGEKEFTFPIRNKNGAYFIPILSLTNRKPPSGSVMTDEYVDKLLKYYPYNPEAEQILYCLQPYGDQLKKCSRGGTYENYMSFLKEHIPIILPQ